MKSSLVFSLISAMTMILFSARVLTVNADSDFFIVGTVVTDNPDVSYAVIGSRNSGDHNVYKHGDIINGHYIKSIEREKVSLGSIDERKANLAGNNIDCSYVQIDLDDARLGTLIDIINQFSKETYFANKAICDKKITIMSPCQINVNKIDDYFMTIIASLNLGVAGKRSQIKIELILKEVCKTKSSVEANKIASQRYPFVPSTRIVTIDFTNVDISIFIKFISDLTRINFAFDTSNIRGRVNVHHKNKVSPMEAYSLFQSELQKHGYEAIESKYVVKILPLFH